MASPELTLVDKESSRSDVDAVGGCRRKGKRFAKADLRKVLQNGDNKRREHYKFGKTGPAP